MSKCISSHGEYSEHEPGDPCPWCGEYDMARIIAERDAAEARIQAVEELCDAAEDPDQWPPRPVIHGGEPFPASLMVDDIRRAMDGDQ